MENKIVGSNQGESSNEWKGHKTPFQMASCENREGAESGQTSLIGAPVGVNLNATFGLNGSASNENRSAKFKAPNVSQNQGEGAGQY